MTQLEDSIKKNLLDLKNKALYRSMQTIEKISLDSILINQKKYINLSSNDYLNLSQSKILTEAAQNYLIEWGTSVSASRLITGNIEPYHLLEEKTAEFKKKEKALIFSSGYSANLGIIGALAQLKVVFLSDKLIHASLIDGIRLAKAEFYRFLHNDLSDAEKQINLIDKNKIIILIVDSVYSMDGDIAPIKELVELKKKYQNLYLYFDEAHSTGILGSNSRGLCEEYSADIDIIMGTFGKAFGSFGAYVACSDLMYQFLVNHSRSLIYSTGLPPAVIGANIAAIDLLLENPHWGQDLLIKSEKIKKILENKGYNCGLTKTQIIPLIIGENKEALDLSEKFKKQGLWINAIRSPTVAKGTARLRLTISRLLDDSIFDSF
jgi:8-amino-7-oxononanoate synthase